MMETPSGCANELSRLDYVCQELGARSLITKKFHVEYSVEGIEYSWGYGNI